jgi:predicted enzyme related to lactoylglutathione lyase
MGNRICYFEIMVSDPDKSREFYGRVFDWKIEKSELMMGDTNYYMIDTGAEPSGGMMKKPDQAPMFGMTSYILVDSIDETLEKAMAAGASPGTPRTEIPKTGWWALFMDPDGIPIMLYEPLDK